MLVSSNNVEEINNALLALSQQISNINASLEAIRKAIKELKGNK